MLSNLNIQYIQCSICNVIDIKNIIQVDKSRYKLINIIITQNLCLKWIKARNYKHIFFFFRFVEVIQIKSI